MEKETKCKGFKVRIRYKDGGEDVVRHITEIHYGYPSPVETFFGKMIAFESDIEATGFNRPISEIEEFEAVCEVEDWK